MKEELISIIVPVYNAEEYLEQAIGSILNQTYRNIELIIINDGSTDKSAEICNQYLKTDKRIKIFYQENKGVSTARNIGLNHAIGKYIIFLDADDYIESNMIEKLYYGCINQNCDIAICNYTYICDGKKQFNIKENEIEKLNSNDFRIGLFKTDGYAGYLWNKLIKKEIIKDVRFNDEIHIMEDLIFLCNISYNIEKACFFKNEFLYNYIKREKSALNTINEKYISAIKAYEIIEKYVNQLEFDELQNKFYFEYIFTIMNCYYYLYCNNKLTITNKIKLKKIRNAYICKDLRNTYYGLNKKIKLCICSFFPIIYGKLKDAKLKQGGKNE